MGDGVYESPIHQVTVRTFFMDKAEVTTAQYSACVTSGACTPPTDMGAGCNYGVAGRGKHPINCTNWFQAVAYCRFVGKRLPTEEEWEFAARGPEARAYPWGDAAPSATRLNACGDECTEAQPWRDAFATTSPVGSFPDGDSPLGIHDLAGNVWEMTSSAACPYPASACTSCPSSESCSNPCGGCASAERVSRGGGWADLASSPLLLKDPHV